MAEAAAMAMNVQRRVSCIVGTRGRADCIAVTGWRFGSVRVLLWITDDGVGWIEVGFRLFKFGFGSFIWSIDTHLINLASNKN